MFLKDFLILFSWQCFQGFEERRELETLFKNNVLERFYGDKLKENIAKTCKHTSKNTG